MAVQVLIEANVELLRQGTHLLETMDDADFRAIGRVGPQLRHILEFYECFLGGVARGVIDYDARQRDQALETNREVALGAIRSVSAGLMHLGVDKSLQVRMEDAPPEMENALLPSSVRRELQVLASHTTHHFALIAMILSNHGHTPDPDFGVARSTLRHRAGATACAR